MIPAYKIKVEGRDETDGRPTTYVCFTEASDMAVATQKAMRWAKKEKLVKVRILSIRDVGVNLLR